MPAQNFPAPFAGLTVPERGNLPRAWRPIAFFPGGEDGLPARSSQPIGANFNGRRTLRAAAKRQAINPEYRRFLLNTAGVGQHDRTPGLKAKKVEVAERICGVDAGGKLNAAIAKAGARARMHRPVQRQLFRNDAQRGKDFAQRTGIIDVGGAMQRD